MAYDTIDARIPMKTKSIASFISLSLCLVHFSSAFGFSENLVSDWHTVDLPFRPLNVASNGSLLWACGTDEAIAVSSDAGAHWQVKHQTTDGNLLLNVEFADETFGYAAGTGGLYLTTQDGGQSWVSHSAGFE